MRCCFFSSQLLNYFSVDETARVLIYAFFSFGTEFYFLKRTKQRVFNKVNPVTHPDKIMVCWFIRVILESRDELSGFCLQNHAWNRERTNGIFRQDLGNFRREKNAE